MGVDSLKEQIKMSKSSEDTFCSEQKLVFGDYSRRWACRATIARSTIPIRVGARRLVSSRPCPAQEQHRRVHLHHAARRSQRIVCARLPLDKKKCSVLLVACKNIWFAAVPAHAASAPALAGQQIDEVTVTHIHATRRHPEAAARHAQMAYASSRRRRRHGLPRHMWPLR